MGKNQKSVNMSKKSSRRVLSKKKIVRFLFLGCTSFVFTVYFFSLVINTSIEIIGKYKEKDILNEELNTLKEKEVELSTDVLKLQDSEYIARYLREKYYYSKEGEFILRFPKDD